MPDTIAAIATAHGAAGIGVIRLSGPDAARIATALTGRASAPRQAAYRRFSDAEGNVIDDGLVLWFPAPASYTGEDVVELQAHGSPPLLRILLARCLELGARMARPGEFTERAFLNHRLDLAQAEAVADLIAAGSEAAARAARRALDGAFSREVEALAEALAGLRIYVEAAIDFPEDEIDFLSGAEVRERLADVQARMQALLGGAARGVRLNEGLHVVIVGPPNAGKSSLLNALAGDERAIVTDIPGTTRDLLREAIRVDGVELTLVDTAGLRDSVDVVEAEGMRRARSELARADLALAVLDARDPDAGAAVIGADLAGVPRVLWLHNKCDLADRRAGREDRADGTHLWLSARTGDGLDALRAALADSAGLQGAGEGSYTARTRHLDALRRADDLLRQAAAQLAQGAGELAAEDLRQALDAIGEITGRISPDDLLGRIFGSFCIGK